MTIFILFFRKSTEKWKNQKVGKRIFRKCFFLPISSHDPTGEVKTSNIDYGLSEKNWLILEIAFLRSIKHPQITPSSKMVLSECGATLQKSRWTCFKNVWNFYWIPIHLRTKSKTWNIQNLHSRTLVPERSFLSVLYERALNVEVPFMMGTNPVEIRHISPQCYPLPQLIWLYFGLN